VLQERFLAPCTLHFAANQLFLECKQRSRCETFPILDSRHKWQPWFYGSRVKEHGRRWMTWQSNLAHYSRALLTEEEDKLFAMAAIATYYQSLTHDKYLVGLWQRGIERQLLWSSVHSLKNRHPSRYRAPSWSWASLDGPIKPCRWMGKDLDDIPIRALDADQCVK
jgi:hypothetical protein